MTNTQVKNRVNFNSKHAPLSESAQKIEDSLRGTPAGAIKKKDGPKSFADMFGSSVKTESTRGKPAQFGGKKPKMKSTKAFKSVKEKKDERQNKLESLKAQRLARDAEQEASQKPVAKTVATEPVPKPVKAPDPRPVATPAQIAQTVQAIQEMDEPKIVSMKQIKDLGAVHLVVSRLLDLEFNPKTNADNFAAKYPLIQGYVYVHLAGYDENELVKEGGKKGPTICGRARLYHTILDNGFEYLWIHMTKLKSDKRPEHKLAIIPSREPIPGECKHSIDVVEYFTSPNPDRITAGHVSVRIPPQRK